MKNILVFSLLILSVQPPVFVIAQSNNTGTDYNKLYKTVLDEYGFDQVLVNGISFEDKYQPKVGHQFFQDDQLHKGTLIYRGNEYQGLEMKYDICNQQLILFIKHNYTTARIIPANDFISAFSFGGKFFSKYNFQGEQGFYQVVFDTEKLKCLYYWYKLVQGTGTGNIVSSNYYHYEFTNSMKKSYLKLDGSFERYSDNRSFTELFPKEIKAGIRKYLKTNRINVAKSSDERIRELLSYCNSLI